MSTKERLLEAAKRLFAEKGFAGASVRDICAEANAGRNLIHHYFGSKDGLYQAILTEFSDTTFDVPLRIIADAPASAEEMQFKFKHFVSESLEALVARQLVFRIISREAGPYLNLSAFRSGLIAFLSQCQTSGFLAKALPVHMVPSLVLDRLGNQIIYALSAANSGEKTILNDVEYRREWSTANAELILFGIADRHRPKKGL